MKIKPGNIVKIIATAAILLFLFWKVEFNTQGFGQIISNVRFGYLLLSLPGVLLVLGLKSYRWRILIQNEGFIYKKRRAFGAFMASDAIGIITPGRIGEIARLYYLRQETAISFYAAFKTIISDRVFDFSFLGWFGLSGMLFYFKSAGDFPGIYYVTGVWVMFVIGYLIGIKLLAFACKKTRFGRVPVLRFLLDSLLAVTGKQAVKMWLITLAAYCLYFFFSWIIMFALHLKPTYVDVAFIMSIMSLSTIIPISVAGFGTREATLVLLFSYYGLPGETAISFSILHFASFFLWGGIIGLIFWWLMPISLQQVKDDSRNILKLFQPEKTDN